MNIYFSCSITGGRAEEAIYQTLVQAMLTAGHEVPTAHLSLPSVTELEKAADPVEIFERDMNWIKNCDAVVAEVSSPSHGVGYEIALALSLNKPVLCLYKAGKNVSKIITGNTTAGLVVSAYAEDSDAVEKTGSFLAKL